MAEHMNVIIGFNLLCGDKYKLYAQFKSVLSYKQLKYSSKYKNDIAMSRSLFF